MKKKTITDEMKSYYDQRAPWHDELMNYQGIDQMEKLFQPIIEKIEPIIVNQTVLEIACGTGNWTQVLTKRAKYVTAIDSSKQSLDIAKQKLQETKNLSFKLIDAYSIDTLTSRYDTVFAADFFSHIPKTKIDSFLLSLHKVMQPKSQIIFLDMSVKREFQQETVYIDSDENRVSKRELPDGTSYDVVKNFHSEYELLSIFSKFGNNISYTEIKSLKRWMITYQTK